MLNISGIHEGFVLDHIQAGMSLQIYHDLKLDQLDCPVAIIKNAKSSKMGKKDILKVECPIDALDFDILGFIDHNITVNVIQNDKIVSKKELRLPKQVKNVIKCKNPRCITSIEQELDQIFILTLKKKYTAANTVRRNIQIQTAVNNKILEQKILPVPSIRQYFSFQHFMFFCGQTLARLLKRP